MRYYQHFLKLREYIEREGKAILMVVVDHKGSSPGKTGFKMIVGKTTTYGTIGGGIMEYNLVEKYRSLIPASAEFTTLVHSTTTRADEIQSGLSCAGKQTVAIVVVTDSTVVTAIIDNYFAPTHSQFKIDSTLTFSTLTQEVQRNKFTGTTYTENLGLYYRDVVYVFGGGHVGFTVTKFLSLLDFHISIVDHREELELITQNTYAHKKITGQSYNDVLKALQVLLKKKIINPVRLYLIVVTTDMNNDIKVLRAIFSNITTVRYIGLMGSKSKLQKIKSHLQDIPDEFVQQLHAPIGLSINSTTVEEIAVAISAELIQVKNTN